MYVACAFGYLIGIYLIGSGFALGGIVGVPIVGMGAIFFIMTGVSNIATIRDRRQMKAWDEMNNR